MFVAAPPGAERPGVRAGAGAARRRIAAELDLAGRSLKGQMKHADRLGAARAVIIDDDGSAQVRDMSSGEQRELELGRALEQLAG